MVSRDERKLDSGLSMNATNYYGCALRASTNEISKTLWSAIRAGVIIFAKTLAFLKKEENIYIDS